MATTRVERSWSRSSWGSGPCATPPGRVFAGEGSVEDVLPLVPYPADAALEPVQRAVAQLRGEI